MTTLEAKATAAWRLWGAYGKTTTCTECGAVRYCRAKRQRGAWLCVSCFDLNPPRGVRL